MSIHYRREGNYIVILGQTYPHREAIRSLGCHFVGQRKVWQISYSESALEQVSSLCLRHGGGCLETMAEDTEDVPDAVARRADPLPPQSLKFEPNKADTSSIQPILPLGLEFNIPHLSSNEPQGVTVKQLIETAFQSINRAFPQPIWVLGEIQNLQKRANATYLALAEGVDGASEAATITLSATIWSNALRLMEQRHGREQLQDILADGIKIRALCQVSLYRGRGSLSLAINDIDIAYSKGALALARERLLKELTIKNIIHQNKKLNLSSFPFKIGLISAEGSRALADFTNHLFENDFCGQLILAAAATQGEKVIKDVPKAIQKLQEYGCDAIVLTRGGGSAADLRWFDASEVAYAICNAKVPIIAAIGHYDDESVAEIVAFQKCKTPTAAADFILDRFNQTATQIEMLTDRIVDIVSRNLLLHSERLSRLREKLLATTQQSLNTHSELIFKSSSRLENAFQNKLQTQLQSFNRLGERLTLAAIQSLAKLEQGLALLDKNLTALDPSPWLKQGWTQLFKSSMSKEGAIKSVHKLHVGELLKARLLDGNMTLQISDISPIIMDENPHNTKIASKKDKHNPDSTPTGKKDKL
ncbi:MAG: exodeoxyribonuclease VII large subunit [Bdellovibrionota bacterium]